MGVWSFRRVSGSLRNTSLFSCKKHVPSFKAKLFCSWATVKNCVPTERIVPTDGLYLRYNRSALVGAQHAWDDTPVIYIEQLMVLASSWLVESSRVEAEMGVMWIGVEGPNIRPFAIPE